MPALFSLSGAAPKCIRMLQDKDAVDLSTATLRDIQEHDRIVRTQKLYNFTQPGSSDPLLLDPGEHVYRDLDV